MNVPIVFIIEVSLKNVLFIRPESHKSLPRHCFNFKRSTDKSAEDTTVREKIKLQKEKVKANLKYCTFTYPVHLTFNRIGTVLHVG